MHAGPLNMFHDTRNQNIRTVAHAVDFHFFADQILIDQNRMLLNIPVNNRHKFYDIAVVDRNLHTLTAENVGRAHKHRIAQLIGCL